MILCRLVCGDQFLLTISKSACVIQFILFLEHFQKTQSAVHESNKSKQIHAAKNTPTIHKLQPIIKC